MRKKWLALITMILSVLLLTGCNEVDQIFGKVNKILDQQLEGSEETGGTLTDEKGEAEKEGKEDSESYLEEATDEEVAIGMSDGHENEADPMYSFEERLQMAGYSKLDPPNGIYFPFPEDFVLVEELPRDHGWEGVYCFNTQLDETIADTEERLRVDGFDVVSDPVTIESDNVHSTKFSHEGIYEIVEGDMVYFIDDYGTTCTEVYFEIKFQ